MREKSFWDIPFVVCFLIGLVVVLIGISAATWHVIGWVETNHWKSSSFGEMMTSFGDGGLHDGWGGEQNVADWLWAAPFWAVTLVAGVVIIYVPNVLRLFLGRR